MVTRSINLCQGFRCVLLRWAVSCGLALSDWSVHAEWWSANFFSFRNPADNRVISRRSSAPGLTGPVAANGSVWESASESMPPFHWPSGYVRLLTNIWFLYQGSAWMKQKFPCKSESRITSDSSGTNSQEFSQITYWYKKNADLSAFFSLFITI